MPISELFTDLDDLDCLCSIGCRRSCHAYFLDTLVRKALQSALYNKHNMALHFSRNVLYSTFNQALLPHTTTYSFSFLHFLSD